MNYKIYIRYKYEFDNIAKDGVYYLNYKVSLRINLYRLEEIGGSDSDVIF